MILMIAAYNSHIYSSEKFLIVSQIGKGMPDKINFVNIHMNLLSLFNIDII